MRQGLIITLVKVDTMMVAMGRNKPIIKTHWARLLKGSQHGEDIGDDSRQECHHGVDELNSTHGEHMYGLEGTGRMGYILVKRLHVH